MHKIDSLNAEYRGLFGHDCREGRGVLTIGRRKPVHVGPKFTRPTAASAAAAKKATEPLGSPVPTGTGEAMTALSPTDDARDLNVVAPPKNVARLNEMQKKSLFNIMSGKEYACA